jgi:tRNA(Ile)-lysidine synthase
MKVIQFVKPEIKGTKVYVALSGGIDSVVLLHLLKNRKCDIECLFFHHNTNTCDNALHFVTKLCHDYGIVLHVGYNTAAKPSRTSWEEFWRDERYKFLDSYTDRPICLGHHADDVLETWIWSCANGTPKLINYSRNNCIRPLLLVSKDDIRFYANRNNLDWCEDDSNDDVSFTRNKIRKLLPFYLEVNPSLRSTLVKKIRAKN